MGNLSIKQRLTQLIQEGISFEVSQGKLLVKGNLSALDTAQKEFLKDNKEAIISLIESQTQEIPEIKKNGQRAAKTAFFFPTKFMASGSNQ